VFNVDDFRSHYFLAINEEISSAEFMFREFFLGGYLVYGFGREQHVVTDADLIAFEWIEENTESDALFLNSYTDAGLWIPSIPFRPVVTVHTNPFMVEAAKEMQIRTDYDYFYVGNKRNVRVDDSPIDLDLYDNDPDLELVFREEGASIYKMFE